MAVATAAGSGVGAGVLVKLARGRLRKINMNPRLTIPNLPRMTKRRPLRWPARVVTSHSFVTKTFCLRSGDEGCEILRRPFRAAALRPILLLCV